MSPKDSFWTGLQGGLLDKKHYLKMGMSIWLFGYLTRSQTALNKAGEGVVNYGHPLTLERISDDLKGISVRTIKLWAERLRREGYIRTEEHGPHGLTFWIAKAKQKTKKPKFANPDETQSVFQSRHNTVPIPKESRHNTVPIQEPSRHPTVSIESEISAQVPISESLAAVSNSPTPKGSTPKNLSYYNNTADAKNASASLSSLFKKTAKAMQTPGRMSPRELDARRRELLSQAEEVKRKYPAKGNGLGKVAAATA